jgi:hypothetical protein
MIVARQWVKDHNMPVFVLALDRCNDPKLHIPACPNCDGMEMVYIRLAEAGPYKTPGSGKNISTWYDGDGQYGKGWYIIDRTIGFECPHCKGKPYTPGPAVPARMPIDITAVLPTAGL